MFDQFQQNTQAVGDSLFLSAMCALIPLAVLFILLGGLKVRAWISGLIALGAAIVVAVALFGMPAGQALSAAAKGVLSGACPPPAWQRFPCRLLPDLVDRDQRGVDLQPHRGVGPLRSAAPLLREGQPRPADPGDHHPLPA